MCVGRKTFPRSVVKRHKTNAYVMGMLTCDDRNGCWRVESPLPVERELSDEGRKMVPGSGKQLIVVPTRY